MVRGLRWYAHRLRAMPLPELAHRTWRVARHPFDRARMRIGLYATPPAQLQHWRGPRRFYFESELVARTAMPASFRDAVEHICSGRREILGLGVIDVPREPWHWEPRARASWPLIDAARVLASAPPHFDARLTWELNRGHEWVVLARAWATTRDVRYRKQLDEDLASWRRQNPLGMGINWASAMEAAIRIHSLAWVAGFRRGDALGDIAAMIYEHAAYVQRNLSAYSSANNHLIVELTGLAVAARVLHGTAHHQAVGQLHTELARQVFPDGVNAEMATHYHAFVLEALLLTAYLERAHGEPRVSLEGVIARMADYLRALQVGDGTVLQQGDNDDGKILALLGSDHVAQLLEAQAALAHPRSSGSTREGVWWLTNGGGAVEPGGRQHSRLFGHAGQVVLRSEALHVVFDAGPFGFGTLAAHAHCDALSIAAAVDGRRLLVDRGTYRYNGDLGARDRFRMTAAHNTVQLETLEQGTAAGPFLWTRDPDVTIERCELADERDLVIATHTGFAPAIHRRTLLRTGAGLLVVDVVTGGVGRRTARYHLAPELSVSAAGAANGVFEIFDAATHQSLAWLSLRSLGDPASIRIVMTEHSDRYGEARLAPTIEASADAGHLVAILAPARCEPAHMMRTLVDLAVAEGVLPG